MTAETDQLNCYAQFTIFNVHLGSQGSCVSQSTQAVLIQIRHKIPICV